MNEIFDLSKKVAIVTGGYGHLGSKMSLALLEAGATVIVAGRTKSKFEDRFMDVNKQNLLFRHCDIMQEESFKELFSSVYDEFGSIDILVNNAHSAKGGGQEISNDDWAYTLDGVLAPVHRSIKSLIPYLKKQGSGKIVNISSMYGVVSPDFRVYEGDNCERFLNPPHYGAAKAAMIQLTKYYAVQLGAMGVQVNALTPGPFPKEIIQEENPAFIERLKAKNPLHKIGIPDNLIGPLVMLSSQGSDFMTGQNIIVDGGWTIW